MNEEQVLASIRNQLRLENLARQLPIRTKRLLETAFESIAALIAEMPAGSIERDVAYRTLTAELGRLLIPANQTMLDDLLRGLEGEVQPQVEWAAKFLEKAPDVPPGLALSGVDRGIVVPFTAEQLTTVTQSTEVLGVRLADIFKTEKGKSPFTASVLKKIDRIVKEGFLKGDTNEDIAKKLEVEGAAGSKREAEAISRTAVMDMAQRTHDEFWDQNSDVIAAYQFDATFDYRLCRLCLAANDKVVKRKQDRVPMTPVHPNCRCRWVAMTEESLREWEERDDTFVGPKVRYELREEAPEEKGNVTKVYKRKVRGPDGKMYYRVAVQTQPRNGRTATAAQFLLDTNETTRRSVVGVKRSKAFLAYVDNGVAPEEALRRILEQ